MLRAQFELNKSAYDKHYTMGITILYLTYNKKKKKVYEFTITMASRPHESYYT